MPLVTLFDIGTGGFVGSFPPHRLQPDQAANLSNYHHILGSGSGLLGYGGALPSAEFTPTDTPIALYEGLNGNYVATQTKIYTLDGTERQTGLTSANEGDWTSIQAGGTDYDIFANGTEVKDSTNGTSFTDLANAPANTKFVESHFGFVWAWGYDGHKLHRSDLRAPETWSGGSEIDLAVRGTPSGLLDLGDLLMVHTDRMFLLATARTNATQPQIVDAVNCGPGFACDNARSLVKAGSSGDVYWFNERSGIIRWRGGRQVEPISMQKYGRIATQGSGLTRAHALWNHLDRRIEFYYRGLQGGGAPVFRCIHYHTDFDAYFPQTGDGTSMSAAHMFGDQNDVVYGGSAEDNKVYAVPDSGSGTTTLQTRAIPATLEEFLVKKVWFQTATGTDTTFTVSLLEGNTTIGPTKTLTLSANQWAYLTFNQNVRSLAIKMTTTSVGTVAIARIYADIEGQVAP